LLDHGRSFEEAAPDDGAVIEVCHPKTGQEPVGFASQEREAERQSQGQGGGSGKHNNIIIRNGWARTNSETKQQYIAFSWVLVSSASPQD